jgi:6-pyruvoyltetrahydropterin/6-carboxytetrahydropterin synthase
MRCTEERTKAIRLRRTDDAVMVDQGHTNPFPLRQILLYNDDIVFKERPVYEIMIQDSFSAAHRLREYGGKCEELHGHNWRVDVVVQTEKLDGAGLAIDFRVLKNQTKEVLAALDHAFLNDLPPFAQVNPSSENIARHIYEHLSAALSDAPVEMVRVNVWESDHACASFLGDGS